MPIVSLLTRQHADTHCDYSFPTKGASYGSAIQITNAAQIQGEDTELSLDTSITHFNAAIMAAPNVRSGSVPACEEENPFGICTARYTHDPYGLKRIYSPVSECVQSEDLFPSLSETRETSTVKYALEFAAGSEQYGFVPEATPPSDTVSAAYKSPMSFMASNAEKFWKDVGSQNVSVESTLPTSTLPTPSYPIRHCLFGVSRLQGPNDVDQDYKLLAQYTSLAPNAGGSLVGHKAIIGCTVYTYIAADSTCHAIPCCRPPQWGIDAADGEESQSAADEDNAIATIISMVALQQHRHDEELNLKQKQELADSVSLLPGAKEAQLLQRYSSSGGSSYLPANVRTRRIITHLSAATTRAYMSHKCISVLPSMGKSATTSDVKVIDNNTPIGRGTTPNGVSLAQATKLSHHEAKSRRGVWGTSSGAVSPCHFSAPHTPGAGTPTHNSPLFGTPIGVSPLSTGDDFHHIPHRQYVR